MIIMIIMTIIAICTDHTTVAILEKKLERDTMLDRRGP